MNQKFTLRDLVRSHIDKPELLRMQLDAMSRQIPLVYLIVSVNVVGVAVAFYGDAPDLLTIWTPLVGVSLFLLRSIAWWRSPKTFQTPELALKELNRVSILMAGSALALSSWCVLLFPYGDAFQQSHIAFFISVTLIGTIFASIQLPRSALAAIGISGTAFVIFFMTRGNMVFSAMAVNFIMILSVVYLLVKNYFKTMIAFINSNNELSGANDELQALYEELKFHRDHLADQVDARTAELKEQTLKLEQALAAERKLNEMQNEFVSMVSHEFRTPLAVIDGTARRVETRMGDMHSEEIRDRMTKIRGSVKRLSNLVERALDASRLASGRIQCYPEAYNPKQLVEEILERNAEISSGFTIDVDLKRLPETLIGDPDLMDHVLTNILGNALKYSQKNPHIIITGGQENGSAVISFRDHGVGIPRNELKRVTERFFRASTSTGIQGTGVGLNLVGQIVDMHGGKLEIDSEVGNWTEVRIIVPLETEYEIDIEMDSPAEKLQANMNWEI